MLDLLIVETESSPEINFKMNGKLRIKGRAVSDPDSLLWIIAHEWLSNYSKTNPTNTTLILQLTNLQVRTRGTFRDAGIQ